MAQVELKYTLPYQSSGAVPGANVDIIFTYDANSPIGVDSRGNTYYLATAASGTYQVLGAGNTVVRTDNITGLLAPGTQGGNDNYITPTANPIIESGNGVTFTLDNGNDGGYGNGRTNVYRGGNSLLQDGSNSQSATNATSNPVCFVTGTLIRIIRNGAEVDVPVEALIVGDIAVTASGEHRPIRWIGHSTIDPRRHPRPEEAMPVSIRAHAFGKNKPVRDLIVSPGHAICLDVLGEVLIPAGALINGATIVQEDVDSVTYWHVELDSHDILLAEGQPAESYLDMGNRPFFATSAIEGLDLLPDTTAAQRSHADFCRPFHGTGSIVEAVRMQVQTHAKQLGWRLEWDALADMYLLADGCVIQPDIEGMTARFVVPSVAEEVWLVSRASSPMHVDAHNIHDRRRLGLCVAALKLTDGLSVDRTISMDDPRLDEGFNCYQQRGEANAGYRWTTGRARLPADLWSCCRGHFFLRVELADWAIPHWIGPEQPARPKLCLVRNAA